MKFSFSISKGLDDLVKKLTTGLGKLTFEDNMESFKVENITIPYSSSSVTTNPALTNTVSISNKLTFIPSKYIIVSQEGHGIVTKGVNPDTGKGWDNKFVFLKNHGPDEVTLTVIFMR